MVRGAGSAADNGEGGVGGREPDRGYDDMWDQVGGVQAGDGGCEGGEGVDRDAGQGSRFSGKSGLMLEMGGGEKRGRGDMYSASNWLGRMRSASRRMLLYAGTTSSLT